jgi:hypothetical protein
MARSIASRTFENSDATLFAEGGIGQHHLKTFAWVGEEAGGAKRTKGVR